MKNTPNVDETELKATVVTQSGQVYEVPKEVAEELKRYKELWEIACEDEADEKECD